MSVAQESDIGLELGVLNHCDGSAIWDEIIPDTQSESTHVSVLAGVFGPMSVLVRREERLDSAVVQVTVEPVQGVGSPKLREFEEVIRSIVQNGAILGALHPRTAIHVVLQILCDGRNDGSAAAGQNASSSYLAVGANSVQSDLLLSSAINAACQGLLEAGVAMRSLFVASVVALRSDGVLVTPQRKHFEQAGSAIVAVFTAVFDSSLDKVVYSQATGEFTVAQYQESVQKNRASASALLQLIRENLASSTSGSPLIR